MVHQCQKSGKCASPEVSKIAKGISYKDAEDFAKTKHKGLPERKKKKKKKGRLKSFKEFQAIDALKQSGIDYQWNMAESSLEQLKQLLDESAADLLEKQLTFLRQLPRP